MDQTGKEFPDISYDLSQNLLEKKLVRLDFNSLITSSTYFMKKLNIPKAFEEIDFKKENILSDDKVIKVIKVLVEIIMKRFSVRAGSELKYMRKQIESVIYLVTSQAVSFFQIAKIYLMKEKNLVIKNLVFTTQGTVNTKKTIIKVIEKENLTSSRKFELAAQFFLEEKTVKHLYGKLTKEEKYPYKGIGIDVNFACYFWIWRMLKSRKIIKYFLAYYWLEDEEKQEPMTSIKRDDYVIQNIFRRAVEHHNECAVHYLWSTFVSKLRERQLIMEESICSYFRKATHTNIVIYLILESRLNELKDVYTTKGLEIQMLYKNKRWIDLHIEIQKIIQGYYKDDDYYIMFYNIVKSFSDKDSTKINLEFLRQFFITIPQEQRNMLKDNTHSFSVYFSLLRVVFKNSDYRLARLILSHCEGALVYKLFHSDAGMELLKILVKKCSFGCVEGILKEILTDDQIRRIKNTLFELKNFELFNIYLYFGKVKLKLLLDWFSVSVDTSLIQKFRSEYPYYYYGIVVKEVIFELRKRPYQESFFNTEIILEWLADGNVDRMKSSISLLIKEKEGEHIHISLIRCYKQVTELVLEPDWKYLSELMTWKGCTFDDKQSLGRKLLSDNSLLKKMSEKDSLNYFYEFCNWLVNDLSFKVNDDFIKSFKRNLFKISLIYFRSLIMKRNLDAVKEAIIWFDEQPVKNIQWFIKEIDSELRFYKPETKEGQMKFDKFSEWLKSFICK